VGGDSAEEAKSLTQTHLDSLKFRLIKLCPKEEAVLFVVGIFDPATTIRKETFPFLMKQLMSVRMFGISSIVEICLLFGNPTCTPKCVLPWPIHWAES